MTGRPDWPRLLACCRRYGGQGVAKIEKKGSMSWLSPPRSSVKRVHLSQQDTCGRAARLRMPTWADRTA